MPAFLLNPTVLLGIALAIMSGVAHYYHSEYKVVDAQYEGFKQTTKAVGDAAKAAAEAHEAQDKLAFNQLEVSHEKAMSAVTVGFADERNRLLKLASAGNSGGGKVPRVTTTAAVCGDDAGNRRLVASLQDAERAVGSAIAGYQVEVGKIIESGAKSAATAKTAVDLLRAERAR